LAAKEPHREEKYIELLIVLIYKPLFSYFQKRTRVLIEKFLKAKNAVVQKVRYIGSKEAGTFYTVSTANSREVEHDSLHPQILDRDSENMQY
jgi:hypothetical protein